MKLYQYFYISSDKTENLKDALPLYAITTDKFHAECFEGSREMKHFMKKVFKGNKKDCTDYINRNRGALLDFYDMETYGSEQEPYTVSILCTEHEYETFCFDVEHLGYIRRIPFVEPTIFNDKYLGHLINVQYVTGATVYRNYIMERPFADGFDPKISQLMTDMHPDELSIFMNMFGDKLSLERFADYVLDYSELDENE